MFTSMLDSYLQTYQCYLGLTVTQGMKGKCLAAFVHACFFYMYNCVYKGLHVCLHYNLTLNHNDLQILSMCVYAFNYDCKHTCKPLYTQLYM